MKKMTEDNIIQIVKEKTDFFLEKDELSIVEISDGNINYVYRVSNEKKSVIVKVSTEKIRTSGNPLSTDRSRIEMNALLDEQSMAKDSVPEIYYRDEKACLLIMEDLYNYQNLRYALMREEQFSTLAKDMVDFLSKTLTLSSDLVVDPIEKKEKVKSYINPMLCRISERLVFTEPYDEEENTNVLTKENEQFFIQELYHDESLKLEVAKLKYIFQTKAQSLLHGDLHTGSIFVKDGTTKILDPEFAFYGPAGYDIGNTIANLIFSWARCCCTTKNNQFLSYLENVIVEVIDGFTIEAKRLLLEKTTNRSYQNNAFINAWISDVLMDTAGMCGTELIRRIVGDAKVKDITSMEKIEERCLAERICVLLGKALIMGRNKVKTGEDYRNIMLKIKEEQSCGGL